MKTPQVKPRELVNFFYKQGFISKRQTGSHHRLIHPDGRKISVAIHNKPVAVGTLNSVLRQAEMGKRDFLKLYRKKGNRLVNFIFLQA